MLGSKLPKAAILIACGPLVQVGSPVVKRAENSGVRLSSADAAIVKGMLIRGDRQHDIASWFGVNGGRIGEISKGHKFFDVPPQTSGLPRPGPYMSGKASDSLVGECRRLRSKVRKLLSDCSLGPEAKSIVTSMMEQLNGIIDE